MLECVINISWGRPGAELDAISDAAGSALVDLHLDPHHHRSVFTLAGAGTEDAARAVASAAVDRLDLRTHVGVHPRIGVVDVVPFVDLDGGDDALRARTAFARWASRTLALPCFLYGPERSLPDIRRHAFTWLLPDEGPREPHRTAGACAVGARGVLVAYNVWLAESDLALARRIAASVRSPAIRALGFAVGDRVQVSMNLIDPATTGPAEAYDAVNALAPVQGAELVGLLPRWVLDRVDRRRWAELDLDDSKTIEARVAPLDS